MYQHQCIIIQQQAAPLNPNFHPSADPSELPGDDGEGPDGAGSLQIQGCQEAVWGLAGVPRLQSLAQTAPRLVWGAVDLHSITQDLLPKVDTPSFYQ